MAAACVATLLAGCASSGRAAVHAEARPVESYDVCSTWEDANGTITLPDPCRAEVAPGEWLVVSIPKGKPSKPHSRLWWLFMTLLVI